jgi:hypothetical protein
LLRNDSRVGSWLVVTLEDAKGGIAPIGAEVRIKAGGRSQWRDVAAGDSYMSTHDPRPHFGLGPATVVDEIEIRWPGGRKTLLKNVPARQHLRVKQPSAAPAR